MATSMLIASGAILIFLTFLASVIVLIIVASGKLDIDIFDDYLDTAESWTICSGPVYTPWDQVDAFGRANGLSKQIADALCAEGELDCTYMVADSSSFDRAIVDSVPSDLFTSGFCDALASWRVRAGWSTVVEYTDLAKEGGDWLFMLDSTLAQLAAGTRQVADLQFGGIAGWTVACDCLGRNNIENACTDFSSASEVDMWQALADGTIDATFYYHGSTQADLRAQISADSNVTFTELPPASYSAFLDEVFCAASGRGFLVPNSNPDLIQALEDAKASLLGKDPQAITKLCVEEGVTSCVDGEESA